MIEYILIGFLVILLVVAGYVINNLLNQIDTLNYNLKTFSDKIEEVESESIKYHKFYLELLTQTYSELKRIDKRGSFSSDDEVGFSFNVILTAIETAKSKLEILDVENVDNKI